MELVEKDDSEIFVTLKKPKLVLYNDKHYDDKKDKDFNLSSEPSELLDTCKYPTIEEQVLAFIKRGQKLDLGSYVEDMPVDDSGIDDIDQLATILDDPDSSRQDFDLAVSILRQKKFGQSEQKSVQQVKEEQKEVKEEKVEKKEEKM